MIVVREHMNDAGRNIFGTWFGALDSTAAVRVTIALERIAQGHRSAMKSVGEAFSNIRSTSGRATEFTSARMATGS